MMWNTYQTYHSIYQTIASRKTLFECGNDKAPYHMIRGL